MIDSLSIAVHAFVSRVSMSLDDETPVSERLPLACLIKAHIFSFVCIDMEANACGGSFQTMQ